MRKIFFAAFLISLSRPVVVAQDLDKSVTKTILAIKQNVQCCSVPFSKDDKTRVTTVIASSNGDISIVYNNNKVPASFNLFNLYCTAEMPLGFGLNTTENTVLFKLTEAHTEAIKLNTIAKAKEIFQLLNKLFKVGASNYESGFTSKLKDAVDSINLILEKVNTDRAFVELINEHTIKMSQMPSLRYDVDITKLRSNPTVNTFQIKGIEMLTFKSDGFGKGSRINFYNGEQLLGFMKFENIAFEQLKIIHRLFVHVSEIIHQNKK